jgi:hypothetical protein
MERVVLRRGPGGVVGGGSSRGGGACGLRRRPWLPGAFFFPAFLSRALLGAGRTLGL